MNLGSYNKGEKPCREAFTRIDLAVLILIVGLGATFAAPLFTSHSRARSDTIICQANLAEIGRGYQLWASDHEDLLPFMVEASEGGLRHHLLAANAFMQFAIISNGVSSPKIFVCPADTNTTRRAKNFSASPDGGFMHPAYRNNAVGYFLSFHAQRHLPSSILCGDRNVDPVSFEGCSYALFMAYRLSSQPGAPSSQWNSDIHSGEGNLLFFDGSVQNTTTAELRAALLAPDDSFSDVQGRIHVLLPR